ncbi:MAG: S8 family serine peptidase, partial [Sciscionella sp.]
MKSPRDRGVVPVVLRSLIATSAGAGHFSGTITGGNGRVAEPAQTFSYGFDVVKGHRDLDVALRLANGGADILDAVLVDPNGETADIGGNSMPGPGGKTVQRKGLQLFDAKPIPGRWKLVIVVQNPVVGDTLGQRFDATVGFDPRTDTRMTVQPVTVAGQSQVDLPEPRNQVPSYVVHPDTTRLTVAAASTVP